jgi:hypothetical protein
MPITPRENGRTLDSFNDSIRSSPVWQQFMRRYGIDPARVNLSDAQRQALQRELEQSGVQFAKGMQIDPAGNVNQDQGVSAAWNNPWIRYPLIGGAAMTGLGAAGIGPMAGLFGGASGAAAGGGAAAAGGTLASSSLPTSALMGGLGNGMTAGLGSAVGGGAGLGGVTAAGAGAAGGLGAGLKNAASGLGNQMLDKLASPKGLASLAALVPALMSRGGGSGGGDLMGQNPQLQNLMNMSAERAQRTDPLHQAVTSLAMSRMPVSSRPKG